MRIQKTVTGMAKNNIDSLIPKQADMKPNVSEPHIAPIDVTDPIHEICSFVNGPDTSGVFGDDNIAVAGEIHPSIEP